MSNPLLSEISKGANLSHAETVDKSKPVIESGVTLKKNEHGALLTEVTKGAELKHTETVDKSAPVIDKDAHIKPSNHANLLGEIKSKGTN
ncbi:actobindin [Tieghemostelium lacteum]|uniref:Actobindin n=1 Tax=Tieghemostelium lacteum TaxID=361077 RepID=A0A151Z3K9_TIELA|nr:actobindin [Tieghemostelium lacteum]|eukprot:KYQ88553.1 actobindin [Tieghemostelium lacteum]